MGRERREILRIAGMSLSDHSTLMQAQCLGYPDVPLSALFRQNYTYRLPNRVTAGKISDMDDMNHALVFLITT